MAETDIDDRQLGDRRRVGDDDWQEMGKEGRKRVVLAFLADTGLAMSPQHIWRNLRLRDDMPVSYDTVARRYLRELHEEGLVRRVETEPLEDRRLVDADAGRNSRAWYIVSEAGLEAVGE